MTVGDLITRLLTLPQDKPLTATFSKLFDSEAVTLFGPGHEYRELYIHDVNDRPNTEEKSMTVAEIIKDLETSELHHDVILTYGDEDEDIVSTLGGVEWVNGELYVNTETCPKQM